MSLNGPGVNQLFVDKFVDFQDSFRKLEAIGAGSGVFAENYSQLIAGNRGALNVACAFGSCEYDVVGFVNNDGGSIVEGQLNLVERLNNACSGFTLTVPVYGLAGIMYSNVWAGMENVQSSSI